MKVLKPVITLTEKVDEVKLLKLLASDKITKEQKNMLYKYKNKIKDSYVTVNYHYSKTSNMGRLFAEKGLSYQSFSRKIRHTLAVDLYYDIDMVNAAPTTLQQYCKKNNIECPYLIRYVTYRDKWLKEIIEIHKIDRSRAKKLIIRIMYLGSYMIETEDSDDAYEPEVKIKKIINFSIELRRIANKIYDLEGELKSIAEKDETCDNKKSSVLSLLTQRLEKQCVDSAINFFKINGFKIGTLCFDGFMVEKRDINEKLLEECSKYVFDRMEYKIIFENKKMDEIIELPKDTATVKDDKDVQQKLFRLVKPTYFKYCEGTFYIFSENTGKFDECNKNQTQPLDYYLDKNIDYLYVESKKLEFSELRNYGRESILMSGPIRSIITASRDDDWLIKNSQSSLGFLLFKNVIYDMNNNETIPFDSEIVFHHRVPHNFPKRDLDNIKFAYETSFKQICGDLGNDGFDTSKMDPSKSETIPLSMPLRVAFARALAGDLTAKKFYLCPGRTNAGKSKLVDMFMICFGGFVQQFNAENLAHYDKNSSQDPAQKNRWALIIRFARIIFSSEVNMKVTLNGNDIKKVSSGGDPLVGRTHHKEEVQFIPHFTPFCMLNDIPEITPYDDAVRERLIYYEFPKQFVKEVQDSSFQVKLDPELNKKIKSEKFIDGFIHLMLDAYQYFLKYGQPSFDTAAKENWADGDNKDEQIMNLINNRYTITGDDTDAIKISEFNNFKKSNKAIFEGISLNRVTEILSKAGVTKGTGTGGVRILKGIKDPDPIDPFAN